MLYKIGSLEMVLANVVYFDPITSSMSDRQRRGSKQQQFDLQIATTPRCYSIDMVSKRTILYLLTLRVLYDLRIVLRLLVLPFHSCEGAHSVQFIYQDVRDTPKEFRGLDR